MTHAMKRDRTDLALAAVLAGAPLLPSGPTYLGLPPLGYVELVVPALVVVWLMARAGRHQPGFAGAMPTLPWDAVAAVAIGAAIYGLMADNRLTSAVFGAHLGHAVNEMFRPMNQALHPLASLRTALTFLEGWAVFRLVLAITRLAPDPRRRASAALGGWLLGFAMVALLAAAQYATEFQLHPYWVRANPNLVRAHATLDDPNALGAYMALGVGLLVGLLRLDQARRRIRWGALLGVGAIGLATTMSRSALGAAIVAPLGTLAIGPRPVTRVHRWIRTTARASVTLVVLAVVVSVAWRGTESETRQTNPDGPIDMIVKTFDPRESGGWVLRGRLPWWHAAVGMVGDSPVTGVGLGRFPRLMKSYGGGPVPENAHNLFLQLAAEAGLVGLVAFLALCGATCLVFLRALRAATDPFPRALALGGLVGNLAFLMTLLTGHTLLVPSGQILWASFVAVVGVLVAEPPPVRGRHGRTLALLCSLALIYPVAGVVRQVEPQPDAWGYTRGLFGREQTPDGPAYRWTSEEALLDLPVPLTSGILVLRAAAPVPVREGEPTLMRVTVAGLTREVTFTTQGVQTIRLPLDASSPGRVLVEITVTPALVPAGSLPDSTDERRLGVQLLEPAFEADGGGTREDERGATSSGSAGRQDARSTSGSSAHHVS